MSALLHGDGHPRRWSGRAADARRGTPSEPVTGPTLDEWTGTVGETIKPTVTVDDIIEGNGGRRTYVVRDVETGHVFEWSSARRYGITVDDRLHLSGTVAAHVMRDDLHVTRLRYCFNPLRLS